MAAHLHDSVLQTLALIQRTADDPRRTVTLARQQERELLGRGGLAKGDVHEGRDPKGGAGRACSPTGQTQSQPHSRQGGCHRGDYFEQACRAGSKSAGTAGSAQRVEQPVDAEGQADQLQHAGYPRRDTG